MTETGDDESRTVVPSAFFDQLLAEDAGPPEPLPWLRDTLTTEPPQGET